MSDSRTLIETILMALNAIWCFAAFVQFVLRREDTIKLCVPKALREKEPQIGNYSFATARFLGALNLAVASFALAILLAPETLFDDIDERIILHAFFSAVHLSQFLGNIPVILARRQDPKALWPVLSGQMLRIFFIDGTLAMANGVAVIMMVNSK